MNVRSWLRRIPQPVRVRLDRKKLLNVGEGKNKWRDVVQVIELEQPSTLEALDADGSVIRMTELQDPAEPATTEVGAGPVGKLPPEFAVLQAFGALLLDAYVKGAEQHAKAYELAFAENTKLVTALSQQSRNLQHSLEDQLAQRLANAEGGDDGALSSLGPLMPMLEALMARQLSAPSKTSSNGKKTKDT